MKGIFSLFIALTFLMTACKEKEDLPEFPAYVNLQGNHQSGYFLEPLDSLISVDITSPMIQKVAFVVTKGGGVVLKDEFEKGKSYFRYDNDPGNVNYTLFEINNVNKKITLTNKWLLGCEAENELSVFLYGENLSKPIDTIIYSAVAKKREIWNSACGMEVIKMPYDNPRDFGFVGGTLHLHPNGDIWVLRPYPVYQSTDHGHSFQPLYNALLEQNRFAISDAAISPTGRIFFGTTSNGIIISDDKGISWKYANQGISGYNSIRRFSFLSDTEYLCNSVSEIFYTNNSGDSWTKLNVSYKNYPKVDNFVSAVKLDDTILMIDDWRNLIRSADHGITWELLNNHAPVMNDLRELVKFDKVAYVISENNGKHSIFKSSDKGTTWSKVYENECYSWVNTKNLANPSRLFYAVDWPGGPLYDAKNIYYIDVNGEKGTLVDTIPDLGVNDFIVLPSGEMILSPAKGGIFYNH